MPDPCVGRGIIPEGPLALPLQPIVRRVTAPASSPGRLGVPMLPWIARTLILRGFGGRGFAGLRAAEPGTTADRGAARAARGPRARGLPALPGLIADRAAEAPVAPPAALVVDLVALAPAVRAELRMDERPDDVGHLLVQPASAGGDAKARGRIERGHALLVIGGPARRTSQMRCNRTA